MIRAVLPHLDEGSNIINTGMDSGSAAQHIRDLLTSELEFHAFSDLAPIYVYLASNGDSARTTGKIFAIE